MSAHAREGLGLADLFRGLFPCGSVTGAPKVETMRIIAELEDSPRGVYCGAVGYLAPEASGSPAATFNVPIRTVVVDAETGTAEYGVGGGITWNSRAGERVRRGGGQGEGVDRAPTSVRSGRDHAVEPGSGLIDLDLHVARLAGSADYFGFAFDEANCAVSSGARWMGSGTSGRVRVSLDRRGKEAVATSALPPATDIVRVAVDVTHPVDPSDPCSSTRPRSTAIRRGILTSPRRR